jgi:hypothetical protein
MLWMRVSFFAYRLARPALRIEPGDSSSRISVTYHRAGVITKSLRITYAALTGER